MDKMLLFAKANGSRSQHIHALEAQLPTSPIYPYLEGRLTHPSNTYIRIAELVEDDENERINKLISERRTRIGARIGQVTSDVKREVYGASNLEEIYQNLIDWTQDDEIRRSYEEKLLERAYDMLIALPADRKAAKREQVMSLARGMVVIKHPYALAWQLDIEWKDAESFQEWDVGILREYIGFFPEHGLAKVLKGYLASDASPFPKPARKSKQDAAEDDEDEVLDAEDILILMTEGIDDGKESVVAHRLMSAYYLQLEEYESTVETARKGLKTLTTELNKSGLSFQNNFDAIHSTLATSLVQYRSPRHHPEAKSIFEAILKRKPTFTPALIGVGLILEEQEEYPQAIDFLSRALSRDKDNARIGAEAAWCKALNGNHEQGLNDLEKFLEHMKIDDPRSRDLRAQTLYRIGVCQWELDPSRASRKDRKGAYANFLASIKANMNFAPAYTALGIYYEDYSRDKKRARQCFQKAFELSPSEVEAAERLARSFADQGDWDIVEVIAQRVVDSGKVRPSPGSKKKGISWPYSALGVVQMNKQEYNLSISSFLNALRISPDDYHSYVGLGESYHNSGRYNSALRAFQHAENPEDGTKMQVTGESWFTKYMLANVKRELGEFREAIENYEEVLVKKPREFGVSIALLQTLIEHAWRSLETGFFGQAIDSAARAIDVAIGISEYKPEAFNLWKAVGDACSVFSWVQSRTAEMPFDVVKNLLENSIEAKEYDLFKDNDGIGADTLESLRSDSTDGSEELRPNLARCMHAAVLAQKRAIISCAHDIHAQAVAWYNLGWTEYRAHVCLEQSPDLSSKGGKKPVKFLKASMRCFKRAIELEASNTDFWNSLGIVTTPLNPKVAQHSFVRSLHLNERNARAWTNLGVLYLLQNDVELAHQAFSRAQSTDPDYAHAWLGEGLIALLYNHPQEALLHFTHAFEIAPSDILIPKKQYSTSSFDLLLSPSSSSSLAESKDLAHLIQPLFALQQIRSLSPSSDAYLHLSSLFLERAGAHDEAIAALTKLCAKAEADYEISESTATLARFAQATADLARNKLAAKDYAGAVEQAETALDLTASDEDGGDGGGGGKADGEDRQKVRLSAHLTAGLAHFYLKHTDASLSAFRSALTESGADPDVVCLLAQVLWAKGGREEKNVAREQLFEAVEKHQGHVGVLTLLGAMVTLEGDADGMDAVREELEALRMSSDVSSEQRRKVEQVLDAIAALSPARGVAGDVAELNEAQKAVMVSPSAPVGWHQLALLVEEDEAAPAEMALLNARRNVPPRGEVGPEELAGMYAGTGRIGDALRGVMVAPWRAGGWQALGELVVGVDVGGEEGGVKLS